MTRSVTVANPAERQALRLFPLNRIAGAVRLAAFYGLYTPRKPPGEGVAEPEQPAPTLPRPVPTFDTVIFDEADMPRTPTRKVRS